MLRLVPLAVALGLGAAAATPRGDVTFTEAPLAKDAKLVVESTSKLDVKLGLKVAEQKVGDQEVTQSQHVVCTVEATGADESGVTTAKLTFGKCEETQPSAFGGAAQAKESDFSNATYEAKRDAGGYVAADAAQRSREQKDAVARFAGAALSAPLAGVLGGRTLKAGESVELTADVATKAFACCGRGAKVKSAKLELVGERREGEVDCALFKATLTTTSGGDGGKTPVELTIDWSGEISVSKAGARLVAANLPGVVSMKGTASAGNDANFDFDASGTASWLFSAKPAPK